jgi:hypothetical protein
MSGKSFMNDGGESYCGVVSTKQPNKGDVSPAEAVEKRPQTKENTQQPNLGRTQCRESRPSGLERVREVASVLCQKSCNVSDRTKLVSGSASGGSVSIDASRGCGVEMCDLPH